ncbi:VOC family protein [Candidatus Bathyarchaeota archaeon]|nr:VOC family protein [Candidatus Bathyarchaeota archaeon]MBS7630885.1 VOC family protein [Candidatus Bathyarchaeota archaeon]
MSKPIEGLITFLYYNDLERATKFYEEILGLELVIDQGWAKIFKVCENAHVGLVDGKRGYHRPNPIKPVMVTLVVSDVDSWYRYLKGKNVKTLTEPRDNKELNIRTFLLEDPEGYIIEIEHFY